VPTAHRRFAHLLIELNVADIVHGHSSHHPLPIEVHQGKLILYGCGDLINDYEGIQTVRRQRSDLGCLYCATWDCRARQLARLEIVALQLRRFRLEWPPHALRDWLHSTLDTSCRSFGTRIEAGPNGRWLLRWD
jgi:poly-gamma-glutamate synthesis protein (capsule biosynthesis protein)